MTARQIANGNRAVVEKNGTNTWQIVIMGGAVVLTLASQFWTLANPRDDIRTTRTDLQQSIDRQEKDLRDLINKNAQLLEELEKATTIRFDTLERRVQTDVVGMREYEEFAKREDARIATIEVYLAKLQDSLVSRAEHQQHWNEADQRYNALSSRLDQLNTQFNGTFTIGDQLKALQKQIDDLRGVLTGVHASVSIPSGVNLGPTPIH
jgi:DNA repair exonuclease SbcCD ATPase subunit